MRTKIIATIGPATCARETLAQLAEAGVSVFRLNFSHGDPEFFRKVIGSIRAIEKVTGKTFETGRIPTGKEICSKQIFNLVDRLEKEEPDEEQLAEVLPSVYAGFPGGISPSFDRELRENGLSGAVNGTNVFRGAARETMEGLAAGIGTGSRETRLALLSEAEKRMEETVKKNDAAFPGDLRVTAVWTLGAVGFLMIRFL